jgi:hypothetical protein
MANLLEKVNRSSITRADRIRRLLRRGWTTDMIVEKLAKDDPRKTRVIQMQVGRILVSDEELQADLAAAGHAAVMEQIPEVTKAVVRRAIKGNIPAAKLAMEASGFHNPRVKHEHTGDIKVTIDNAPRPPVVQDDVVDAEVVE